MLKRIFRFLRSKTNKKTSDNESARQARLTQTFQETETLSLNLDKNRKAIRRIFDHCDDLIIHDFVIRVGQQSTRALIAYFDSLTSQELLERSLLRALTNITPKHHPSNTIDWLMQEVIPSGKIKKQNKWVEITDWISQGSVGLFVDGQDQVLLIDLFEDNSRPIGPPTVEVVIKGPAEGFNEDLRTNMGLLRKRLPTSRLAVDSLKVGVVTKTTVNLVYLKGYANPKLIEEIYARVQRIDIDGIISTNKITEFIQDSPYSFFSTIEATERPDRIVGHLLEGGAALIIDGTPFAMMLPTTMANQLQSPDDYYNHYWFASFIRLFRWMGLFVALLAPSVYIAVSTFHQELLPTPLLITVLAAREGVPFPAFIEALLMELTFELLREAGIRLPRAFGQTISIVGAIVIGQAAVAAGLVSSTMVVIVALTAIGSYTLPSVSLVNSIRLLRFLFMIAAAFLGMFGVMAAFSMLLFYLCSLRSFGVPYLSPLAPLILADLKDTLIRAPAWAMLFRPRLIGYIDRQRQNPGQKPGPPAAPNVRRSQRKGGKGNC
ncbi:MAG: spore germination protein [Bacillota bacterium]|jgi:spore germination protein KA